MNKISIRLTEGTVKYLKSLSPSDTFSTCLRKCLDNAIGTQLINEKKRTRTASATVAIVSATQKKLSKNISIRLDEDTLIFIKNYYNSKRLSLALRCAIYDMQHNAVDDINEALPLKNHIKTFYMAGQKNASMLAFLNPIFEAVKNEHKLSAYVEPFAGTANVLLHTPEMAEMTINDLSPELVNFHNELKQNPIKLKAKLANAITSSDLQTTFEKYRKLLKDTTLTPNTKAIFKTELAVATFFTRYFSYYGKAEIFADKNIENFSKNIDYILPFSKRFENVRICKSDALYRLKTLTEKTNNLIYIDAPYINTEAYYSQNIANKNRIFKSHTALRNAVETLRTNNVCLLSYRITASYSSLKRDAHASIKICMKLDKLYQNKNYFYRLKPLRNNQIEILLSTVQIAGFVPYTDSLSREVA